MKQNKFLTALFVGLIGLIAIWQSGTVPLASVDPSLTLSVFDIGQGDAILLTTPNRKHILVDGGPDGTVLTRLGEEMKFNEHTIDLMIVSHNHADHITGLNRVLERYDVKKVWVSGAIHTTNEYIKLLETIKKRGIPTEVVGSGKEEVYDGVTVQVVHPLTNQAGKRPEDQHDATIVTRIDYQQKRLLLTGDINEGHEQAMLDAKQDVAADILKVAHHGSKSGLLPAFLTAVNPKAAIISVGPNNSFGHPAPSILDRLMAAKVAVWRTDEDGTVTCVINSQVSCKGSR